MGRSRFVLPVLAGAAFGLSACQSSIKEPEPSESFRQALDEIMLRQPAANKVKPDQMATRREPVTLKLSLDDCIELAMAHNRAILFEQLNAEIATASVVGAKANLDFILGANLGYTREQREIQSRFFGDSRDEEITAITNVGLSATLPFATGTTVELTGSFARNDSNSPFQNFEFYPSSTLTVTQHLLNGLGFVPNLGNAWMAENDQTIADWQVKVSRNEQAFTVAVAYWSLVEAERELAVLRQQEELARDALALAQSRLDAGIGTKLDVLAQQANLKSQEGSIIQAEATVETRTDELLYAIHPDLLHGYALFDNYRIVVDPQTAPDTTRGNKDEPVLVEEVKAALRRRLEIQQAKKRLENAGIAVRMSEFGLLPTLDLETSFTVNGYGVEFDDSLNNFNEFTNLKYGFGLTFGVPLQNRAARSAMTRAEVNKRSAILSARDAETGIILEVANAVRAIRTARRALDSAAEAARLQAETYDAELQRAQVGLATAFEVKQALNDRTQAELNLVKANIGLQKARLQLQKATGEMGR